MADRRKIQFLSQKSFLFLRAPELNARQKERICDEVRKTAQIRIFSSRNLYVVDNREIVKFCLWQWKRTFIIKEGRVRV